MTLDSSRKHMPCGYYKRHSLRQLSGFADWMRPIRAYIGGGRPRPIDIQQRVARRLSLL